MAGLAPRLAPWSAGLAVAGVFGWVTWNFHARHAVAVMADEPISYLHAWQGYEALQGGWEGLKWFWGVPWAYPPLPALVEGLCMEQLGVALPSARLGVGVFGLLLVLGTYALGLRWGGIPGGILAALWLMAAPDFLEFASRFLFRHTALAAMGVLAFLQALRVVDRPTTGACLGLGAVLGLGLLTRPHFGALLAIPLGMAFHRLVAPAFRRGWPRTGSWLLLGLAAAGLAAGMLSAWPGWLAGCAVGLVLWHRLQPGAEGRAALGSGALRFFLAWGLALALAGPWYAQNAVHVESLRAQVSSPPLSLAETLREVGQGLSLYSGFLVKQVTSPGMGLAVLAGTVLGLGGAAFRRPPGAAWMIPVVLFPLAVYALYPTNRNPHWGLTLLPYFCVLGAGWLGRLPRLPRLVLALALAWPAAAELAGQVAPWWGQALLPESAWPHDPLFRWQAPAEADRELLLRHLVRQREELFAGHSQAVAVEPPLAAEPFAASVGQTRLGVRFYQMVDAYPLGAHLVIRSLRAPPLDDFPEGSVASPRRGVRLEPTACRGLFRVVWDPPPPPLPPGLEVPWDWAGTRRGVDR